MNVSDFNINKTALLFFDILNGYVAEPAPGQPRVLKPWIQNAVKLSKAGRAAALPLFFAKGNHRPDNATTALLLTDTNNSLTPWPNGEVSKTKMHVIAGDKSSDVLADLGPLPDDYYIVKYRWSAFFQTYLDHLRRCAHPRHAGKYQLHEHVMGALIVGRAAGVADDDGVIVQVARRIQSRGDPDIG